MRPMVGTPCLRPSVSVHWYPSFEFIVLPESSVAVELAVDIKDFGFHS
jgi:hypothetical protein